MAKRDKVLKIKADDLKVFCDTALSINSRIKVDVEADTISFTLMDEAHVMMGTGEVPLESNTNMKTGGSFCLVTKQLADIARLADEFVEIVIGDNKPLELKTGRYTRKIHLIDENSLELPPNVFNREYETTIEIDGSGNLQQDISAIFKVANVISFHIPEDENSLIISSEANETDKMMATYHEEDFESFCNEGDNGEIYAMFPTDYVKQAFSAIPKGATVQLEIENTFPMRIIWSEGDRNGLFVIAPRIADVKVEGDGEDEQKSESGKRL